MDVFCKIINGEISAKTIYEDEVGKEILDVNPRSNGHSLIIPKKHYQDLYDIDEMVLAHVMVVAKKISTLLVEKLNCDGVSLEENNGIVQDVKHFHMHVIPKYEKQKDSNIEIIYNNLKN